MSALSLVTADTPFIDSGNTAWVLAAAALVLFMTPGLALFYGGMVRTKSVLNMMMMSFITMGTVGTAWMLWGYSETFGNDLGAGLLGNPFQHFGLSGVLRRHLRLRAGRRGNGDRRRRWHPRLGLRGLPGRLRHHRGRPRLAAPSPTGPSSPPGRSSRSSGRPSSTSPPPTGSSPSAATRRRPAAGSPTRPTASSSAAPEPTTSPVAPRSTSTPVSPASPWPSCCASGSAGPESRCVRTT